MTETSNTTSSTGAALTPNELADLAVAVLEYVVDDDATDKSIDLGLMFGGTRPTISFGISGKRPNRKTLVLTVWVDDNCGEPVDVGTVTLIVDSAAPR